MKIDESVFFTEAHIESLARECAWVERKSPLTGFKFLLTFTTGLLHTPDRTLAQRAAFLCAACKTEVSPQALDERINIASVAFMQCCLEQALAMAKRPRAFDRGVLAAFDHVYIIDSTNFDLHPSLRALFKGSSGSASKAAMRIQLVLDQALLKKVPGALDLVVTIDTKTYRLVGKKLPDEVVNQRLRKANQDARRKRGGSITDAYRLFLPYALFLTNLPPPYGIDTLFTLYRIRWQIELVFKTWKSILAIHKIRSAKWERVLCAGYGKLILAALSTVITAEAQTQRDGIVISLHRAMQHLRTVALPWTVAILQGASALAAFIAEETLAIARLCKKHRQTNKPTIEIRLQQAKAEKTNVGTRDHHIALA